MGAVSLTPAKVAASWLFMRVEHVGRKSWVLGVWRWMGWRDKRQEWEVRGSMVKEKPMA